MQHPQSVSEVHREEVELNQSVTLNRRDFAKDGEESDQDPSGVGDDSEPLPELRGNPLAVS